MNKILPEMPNLIGEVYAPVMPLWLVNGLRIFSLFFSLCAAWIAYHDWTTMPAFAKVILCLLAPFFFFSALSSKKGWGLYAANPFFLADHSGMYFRHNDAFTTFIGNNNQGKKHESKNWLFVPWGNIANIRLAKVSSEGGYIDGAVFDVNASPNEINAFFDVALKDNQPIQGGMQAVCFYQNTPPSPRKVVADLQVILNKHKASPLREKYERTW